MSGRPTRSRSAAVLAAMASRSTTTSARAPLLTAASLPKSSRASAEAGHRLGESPDQVAGQQRPALGGELPGAAVQMGSDGRRLDGGQAGGQQRARDAGQDVAGPGRRQ